ncbi:hypothetical protein [Nonomuraea sp. NPDC050202]
MLPRVEREQWRGVRPGAAAMAEMLVDRVPERPGGAAAAVR